MNLQKLVHILPVSLDTQPPPFALIIRSLGSLSSLNHRGSFHQARSNL